MSFCATCNQCRAYWHDMTSKSGNDADVMQTQQTFTSIGLIFYLNRTHSFATTFVCIQLSTFVELLYHTFLSITPLHLQGSVGYKHCCGMFTTLHKCKVHYSRVRSTLVPSVACQTTEVTYRSPTLSFLQAKPCADHHLSITNVVANKCVRFEQNLRLVVVKVCDSV